jgi:hypothetical protein
MCFPQVSKRVRVVVIPAGTTPGSRYINVHVLACIQQIIQVVRFSVDINSGEVRSDTAIGNLSLRHLQSCHKEQDEKEKFFHKSERKLMV